ncbi:MAG: hypothetical protein ACTSYQ_04235, partial [Candidatus Odinarchaeia archaeon]
MSEVNYQELTRDIIKIKEKLNNIISNIEKKMDSSKWLKLLKLSTENPLVILIEIIAITSILFFVLSPIYQILFTSNISMLTLFIFSIFISLIIVCPFIIILNISLNHYKKRVILNSDFFDFLKKLQLSEENIISNIFRNGEITHRPIKTDFTKLITEKNVFNNLNRLLNEYEIKSPEVNYQIKNLKFYESILGNYLNFKLILTTSLINSELTVCEKFIIKKFNENLSRRIR